jgi:hypothetical protein
MEAVRRMRAMASLCRQSAASYPDKSWKLLAEAEYWDHLANQTHLGHHPKECVATSGVNNERPLSVVQRLPDRTGCHSPTRNAG